MIKLKDLPPGKLFSYLDMHRGQTLIALKLASGDVCLLASGEIVKLRGSKHVNEIEGIDETFHIARYKDRLIFAKNLKNGRILVKEFMIKAGFFALQGEVEMIIPQAKLVQTPQLDLSQVNIMLSAIDKEMTRLQRLVEGLKIMLEVDIMLPEKIMSTLPGQTGEEA